MTAVQYFDEKLQDIMSIQYGCINGVRKVVIPLEDYMKFKQEALDLEKEQIINFANKYADSDCIYCSGEFDIEKRADEYYDETFKTKL